MCNVNVGGKDVTIALRHFRLDLYQKVSVGSGKIEGQ